MQLQYEVKEEIGNLISDVSASELPEWIARLSVDDFLILENSEKSWIQTRCEAEGKYRLEYLDDEDQTIYATNPERVGRNEVVGALCAFANGVIHLRNSEVADLVWMVSEILPEPIVQSSQALAHNAANKSDHSNGYQFEEFVAKLLQKSGWDTRLTKKSGDQGLDVLACDDIYRVALQCKRYTSAVGNSAVQEAHAAADFIGATHSVLVATSGFTASAQQLAEALGVVLLKESDLPELRGYLAFISPRPTRKGVNSIFRT